MARVKANFQSLSVPAIFAAVLKADDLVKITGNATVNKAGANEFAVGSVLAPARAANADKGSVETRFRALMTVKANGALTAGTHVKLSSDDGSGNQRVAAYVEGTDAASRWVGTVWVGGADGADIDVLFF
jgi:hypothetical protein